MTEATARRFDLEPFSYDDARALMRELGVAEPVAIALVRRGHRTVDQARAFLAANESYPAEAFAGIGDAVDVVHRAIERGERITVHGDYDVDGVCSTAILVSTLRELGATCDWLIPDRAGDGYGLTEATLARLLERDTKLLITADCGITSVAEVAAAREQGIAVVVTDHHQPAAELPDCPIVHPIVSAYPCPDLCATAVAYKLAEALAGTNRDRDLDLVALATVADMVPLLGENRSLVRRGLEVARRAQRPGLRALMAVSSLLPERLDASDLGFRLAPRINAAGRLYRADAGVELMLTGDDARAKAIARELDGANRERRDTEADVLADAERQLAALPSELREPGIVLWGEGWHPGVVGICASRMVERHHRPAVLISLNGAARGRGSGRSVAGFDLLAALQACAARLSRFGGHRAAAGLEIERGELEAFRSAFLTHVAATLDPSELIPSERIDAIVGGESLGHEVAAGLERLGPFGMGNPAIRLLAPAARLQGVRSMGEGERHARFSLASGRHTAAGVAFGVGSTLAKAAREGPVDVSMRLELDEWNGAVEPRVILGEIYGARPGETKVVGCVCADPEYRRRLEAELDRPPADRPPPPPDLPRRERVDRGGASGIATVAALASSGEPVLVLTADAIWRRGLIDSAAPPARFGGGEAALVASRGSLDDGLGRAERVLERGGVALADWQALALAPQLPTRFRHVIVVDPAPSARLLELAEAGSGYIHVFSAMANLELARRALELIYPDRPALAEAWRGLRAAGPVLEDGASVRGALEGAAARSPEAAACLLRVLRELDLVRGGPGTAAPLEVVSSIRADLEKSTSFAAYRAEYEECVRFLNESTTRSSSRRPLAA